MPGKQKKTLSAGIIIGLVFTLLFSFKARTQEPAMPHGFRQGYIITLENDTLPGYLEYSTSRRAHLQCKYISEPGADLQVLGPRDIIGYGFGNELVFHTRAIDLSVFLEHINFDINQLKTDDELISLLHHFDFIAENHELDIESLLQRADGKPVTMQPIFLRVVLESYLSLYIYDHMLFAQKKDQQVYLLRQVEKEKHEEFRTVITIHREYLGVLSHLTADCPIVNASVKQVNLSVSSVLKLIQDYNECRGFDYRISDRKSAWIRLNPGISFFSGFSGLSMKNDPNNYSLNDRLTSGSFFLNPGLAIDLDFPWSSRKFYISSGISFYKTAFNDFTYTYQFGATEKKELFYFEHTYLKTPLTVYFSPWDMSWKPSFVAGVAMDINLHSEYKHQTLITDNQTMETTVQDNLVFIAPRIIKPVWITGVSVRRELGNAGYLVGGLRYELSYNIIKFSQPHNLLPFHDSSRQSFISFHVAYMFYLND